MKHYNIAEIDNIYFSSENCETFEFASDEILELSVEPIKTSEEHDVAVECPSARLEDGVLTIKMGELSEITHVIKVEHGIHSKTPLQLIDKLRS